MATYFVTQNGAGAFDGSDWDNAFRETDRGTWFNNGHTAYIRGDMTASSDWRNASADNFRIIGVKPGTTSTSPTLSDMAFGSDRPTINLGTYFCQPDTYNQWCNLQMTSSNQFYTLNLDVGALVYNCKIGNTGNGNALNLVADSNRIIGSEFYGPSAAGKAGIYGTTSVNNTQIFGCLVHDCINGILMGGLNTLLYSVVHGGTGGSGFGCQFNGNNNLVMHSVIDDWNNGLECDTGAVVLNNMITNNTVAGFASSSGIHFVEDGNNWYNNGTDWDVGASNILNAWGRGRQALTEDPQYTDTANHDFTSGNANLLGVGLGVIKWSDMITGDFEYDVGMAQTLAAGGGAPGLAESAGGIGEGPWSMADLGA